MGFAQHIDYPSGTTTLGSAYTAGSGVVTLAVTASTFLGGLTPTSANPVRFTLSAASSPSTCCHYSCTGSSGSTLTGVAVLKGTDQSFSVGDNVQSLTYAEDFADLQAAVITINTGAGLSGGASISLNGSTTINLVPFAAAGASHAQGGVPDPGATGHANPYLLGDNASWIQLTGSGVSYAAGVYTIAAGSGTVNSGTAGQLAYYAGTGTAVSGAAKLGIGTSGQLNFVAITAPGTPSNGDRWYDVTQNCFAHQSSNLLGYEPKVIYAQKANVTISGAVTASMLSATVPLAAGSLNTAGRTVRVTVRAFGTTAGASPGTITINALLGANVIATTNGAPGLTTGISTPGRMLTLELDITVLTTGTSGTLNALGDCRSSVGGTASYFSNNPTQGLCNGTVAGTQAPGTPITLDLTQAYALDLQVTFSATGNTWVTTNLTVEVLA